MNKRGKVALFWPEERIEALQQFSKDQTLPDENIDKSSMWAWMREFCSSAPSWLVADSTRLRLQVKAQDALAKVNVAQTELESLLEALEAMAPLSSAFQDRWASRIVNAPHEAPVPAQRPNLDPEKPDRAERVPKPGQKLPSEIAFDLAHGKPTTGQSEISVDREIAEVSPVQAAKAPPNSKEEKVAGIGRSNLIDLEGHKRPLEQKDSVCERSIEDEAAGAPVSSSQQTVSVRRADGSVLQRKTRVGFRMALQQIETKHGADVVNFLLNKILSHKPRHSTEEIRAGMSRFRGNYPTVQAAREACLAGLGPTEATQDLDAFKLTDHALVDEREDGSCSLWAKE